MLPCGHDIIPALPIDPCVLSVTPSNQEPDVCQGACYQAGHDITLPFPQPYAVCQCLNPVRNPIYVKLRVKRQVLTSTLPFPQPQPSCQLRSPLKPQGLVRQVWHGC